jgi:predicted kinase
LRAPAVARFPLWGQFSYYPQVCGTNRLTGDKLPPILIIFGGLPGTGKTAIARELACRIGAVYLRIDSIEQAIRTYGTSAAVVQGAGYGVAYAIAQDNLRVGRTVIADSVNPLQLTRDAWVAVAAAARNSFIEIEVTCSDAKEHRRRVEARIADIPGIRSPTWEDVVSREYHPWNREHLVIDTAGRTLAESVTLLQQTLHGR